MINKQFKYTWITKKWLLILKVIGHFDQFIKPIDCQISKIIIHLKWKTVFK